MRERRSRRFALAGLAAAVLTGSARAADTETPAREPAAVVEAATAGAVVERPTAGAVVERPTAGAVVERPTAGARELVTVASRATVLAEQAAAARGAVSWRLRALRRLVAPDATLDAVTRARAIDAVTRALARELAEARSLGSERDQARAEGEALAAASRGAQAIGGAPPVVPPVAGAVVARFGVAPDRATGLLLPRAGVRLAAAPRAPVRAPLAGVVARVADEPEGSAVVIDGGAGWTAIVCGLGAAAVAEGQRVSLGDRLGDAGGAAPGAPATVGFEVWRGRHPVDPLLLARPPGPAPAPLADPPRLP